MSKARDLANAGTALTSVSATELGYVDGVTSAIQTQLNSKIGQSTAINPTIVDAKGDIIAATAADTVSRLAVGANDTVLTADSAAATGLKWASPSSGLTKIVTHTINNVAYADYTGIFSSTYDRYLLILNVTAAADTIEYNWNLAGTRNSTNYGGAVSGYRHSATAHDFSQSAAANGWLLRLGTATSPGTQGLVSAVITDVYKAQPTNMAGTFSGVFNASSFWTGGSFGQRHNVSTAYDGISILPVAGNMTGTLTIYGMS